MYASTGGRVLRIRLRDSAGGAHAIGTYQSAHYLLELGRTILGRSPQPLASEAVLTHTIQRRTTTPVAPITADTSPRSDRILLAERCPTLQAGTAFGREAQR